MNIPRPFYYSNPILLPDFVAWLIYQAKWWTESSGYAQRVYRPIIQDPHRRIHFTLS